MVSRWVDGRSIIPQGLLLSRGNNVLKIQKKGVMLKE
jgi:hypothetical protein